MKKLELFHEKFYLVTAGEDDFVKIWDSKLNLI